MFTPRFFVNARGIYSANQLDCAAHEPADGGEPKGVFQCLLGNLLSYRCATLACMRHQGLLLCGAV
jgi:hypothetical protein